MIFLESIPYQIGTLFEDINIDLELRKDYNATKFYSSYRYSEIHLFGEIFESVCYLWFVKNELVTIEYRFHNKYLQLFIDSINNELPHNNKLDIDPFMPKYEYYVFQDNIGIHLINLDKNFFLLKISNIPSMPRINK